MKTILSLLIFLSFFSFGQKKNNSNLNPNPKAYDVFKKIFENDKNEVGHIGKTILGGHRTGNYPGGAEISIDVFKEGWISISVRSWININGDIKRQYEEPGYLKNFKFVNTDKFYNTKILTADWGGYSAKVNLSLLNVEKDQEEREVYIQILGKTNWSHFARIKVNEAQFQGLKNMLSISKPTIQNITKEKELLVRQNEIIAKQNELLAKQKEEEDLKQKYIEENSWKTEVVEVKSLTGRIWMDRNLGASQVSTAADDTLSFGWFYQWGRKTDGHQLVDSKLDEEPSKNDRTGHNKFILGEYWRYPHNKNLWQGLSGVNNPCPNGFRLPTQQEWMDEIETWSSKDGLGAFNSVLKLPGAGIRNESSGVVRRTGAGVYWSSTVYNDPVYFFFKKDLAKINVNWSTSTGYCVRCIKD